MQSIRFVNLIGEKPKNGLYKPADFQGKGNRWIKMKDLYGNMVISNQVMDQITVTEEEVAKYGCIPGDLLFGRTSLVLDGVGTCSIVGKVDDQPIFESNLFRIRLDSSKADSRFYLYYFRSPLGRFQISTIARQTAAAQITSKDLLELEVLFPPLKEQKAIAHILGTLDDKIELNQQMNHTLESIARALFKSWFIDFDPVRAKMDGRQPAGMDMETAALFPDEFEDSLLGKIPKGWSVLPIKDLVTQVFDGPHATPPPSETGAVYLGIKNFTGTALDFSDIRRISEGDWGKWTRRVIPQGGDIVFTYEATLGFFALIPKWLHCCLGRRIALVRPKFDQQDNFFLFHTFIGQPFQQFLVAHTNHGSTVDRILLTGFPSYKILYPPKALVIRFNELACTLWEKNHINQKQNQDVTFIRDSLLPKLLSGEIRAKDVERLVEAVA